MSKRLDGKVAIVTGATSGMVSNEKHKQNPKERNKCLLHRINVRNLTHLCHPRS